MQPLWLSAVGGALRPSLIMPRRSPFFENPSHGLDEISRSRPTDRERGCTPWTPWGTTVAYVQHRTEEMLLWIWCTPTRRRNALTFAD